jgi:hypothetical protein
MCLINKAGFLMYPSGVYTEDTKVSLHELGYGRNRLRARGEIRLVREEVLS